MNVIEQSFSPVFGLPCWGAVYDCQTNLAMNFGAPRLKIREPYETQSQSKTIKRMAAGRRVTVRGQWWLWIFCAYWKIYNGEQVVARYCSSFRKGERAVHYLEGQKLIALKVNARTAATRFEFDLGGVGNAGEQIPMRTIG